MSLVDTGSTWHSHLIPSGTPTHGTPALGETPNSQDNYFWDRRDLADPNELDQFTGLTPKGHLLTFTEGEKTLTSLGQDAFGIPAHSPTNGASHPETPTEGVGQPRVPMPGGLVQGAQGGLGARPKDTSLVGFANSTTSKVKRTNAGTQFSPLGTININTRGSSLSSLSWPRLSSQQGIRTSAPSQLQQTGVVTYSNMVKVKIILQI